MELKVFKFLSLLLLATPSLAGRLAKKPQMGWNSWNTFKYAVDEKLIKSTAMRLVDTGLARLGYDYVNIDDGWQTYQRDSNGHQQANATKFPNGIKAVADYVHSLGLKLGIYSDAGIYDCGFYPGSHGYEELDASLYAQWDVDYLKYDNCGGFQMNTLSAQERFLRMSYALKNSGREIFYSLCEWGHQFRWLWADQFSESYRMSGDIHSAYRADKSGVCTTAYCLNTGYAGVSDLTMIRKMRELSPFQKPGAWADMDMLEIGTGTMTEYQEQTHFSFWAALKSPLIIGADINNISDSSLAILKNKDIISISQDDLGRAANYLPELSEEGEYQIWAGPLSSGRSRHVILVQNYGSKAINVTLPLASVSGLEKRADRTGLVIRDVWASVDSGKLGETIELKNVEVDQVKVLVLKKR
ncbi:glycoside hydrolase family 27 protein [Canariomyces notabilis]|uniref:Alpha-galactosidase n=1 Tax=Canariomyces notabilis TaxID=2074819 RepID=A0AAN6TIQ0_9PEZI|nr:glycoside hydrolase family 27 protein [Canariomyces arenarius]